MRAEFAFHTTEFAFRTTKRIRQCTIWERQHKFKESGTRGFHEDGGTQRQQGSKRSPTQLEPVVYFIVPLTFQAHAYVHNDELERLFDYYRRRSYGSTPEAL